MMFILQADNTGIVYRNGFYIFGALQQALRLQFSQPRPITITSPPKFGFRAIL
jgi:hypothetical protein